MRILYGVQTTGNGHLTRSRETVRALRQRGFDVHVLLSGDRPERALEIDEFHGAEVRSGLTFVTRAGRVMPGETLARLDLPRFYRDWRSMDLQGIDLVISDYEPLTARAARLRRVFSIGLGHQYAFVHPTVPRAGRGIGDLILRVFAPVDLPIGLHWHHFGAAILPPIVPELNKHWRGSNERVLVYLPFERFESIQALLRPFAKHRFMIYGHTSKDFDKGNLHLRAFSRSGFLRDLHSCGAVLCNAGFELPSEALHLGRRLLVKPLQGQPEQLANARALQKLALANVMQQLDPQAIASMLSAPLPQPQSWPKVADTFADWLVQGRYDRVQDLVQKCWQNTGAARVFPSPAQQEDYQMAQL